MATRPVIAVTVRASDATYTTGDPDMFTKDTKTPRLGPDMAEGYKVDTDAFPQSVFAQNKNYEDNVVDQWVKWVSLGDATASGNTHIVETDSSGDINVIGVNCTDVRVTPNAGTDGIEVTTSGGSKGVEVIQDATSTDYGVAVVSADGSAAPGVFVEARSNVGMLISTGNQPGVSIGSVSNGGVIGPSIKLSSNTLDPTDDSVGTMWNREENSIDNVKMGMGGSSGYPVIAKNASCYARSVTGQFVLSGSQTNQTVKANFTWSTDMAPQAVGQVRVTIWGRISLSRTQNNSVTLEVRDKTVGGDPAVCTMIIQSPPHTTGTVGVNQSATTSEIYTLPAAGARNFDLVWTGDVTGLDGTFTGYVEIEQLRG